MEEPPAPGIAHPIATTGGSNAVRRALGRVAVSHRFARRCRGFARKDRMGALAPTNGDLGEASSARPRDHARFKSRAGVPCH